MVHIRSKTSDISRDVPGSVSLDSVASAFGTLPEHVSYDKRTNTVMLLDELISDEVRDENVDFRNFYEKYHDIFPNVPELYMLKLWIMYHEPALQNTMVSYYLQTIVDDLIDVQDFIDRDLPGFKKDLERKIFLLSQKVKTLEAEAQRFSGRIPHTEFVSRSKTFVERSPSKIHEEVLFDDFNPTRDIPFASFNGMYKYLKTFVVDKDIVTEDSARTGITLKRVTESGNLDDILVTSSDNGTEIKFSVHASENPEDIVEMINECIHTHLETPEVLQVGVQGYSYFVGYKYDYPTFSDLVMNDYMMSKIFSIIEFTQASPKHEHGSSRIHNTELKVSGVISSRILESAGNDTNYLSTEMSVGDQYIRVFVNSAATDELALSFVDSVARLLKLYYSEYETIYSVYKKYIPSFNHVDLRRKYSDPTKTVSDKTLFVSNYSRACSKMPTEVDRDSPSVKIEFPKESGVFYTCKDDVYKYPGVRLNTTLSNADIFPYIPCCYKEPQENKVKYKEYYGTGGRARKKQIRMITTDKVLEKGFFGELPRLVKDLFSSINLDKTYVRYGVTNSSNNSFLECLNTATGNSLSRKNLAKNVNPALCVQENPGRFLEEITQMIRSDTYLSPRYYVKALEHVFGVNIYIFNINGLVIPNHVHGYYTYTVDKSKHTVMIYEHEKEQRCELVSEWETKTNTYTHVHVKNGSISNELPSVFSYCNESYAGSVRIVPVPRPKYFDDAVGQYIDIYGKMRGLHIEIDGNVMYIDTTPLPPIDLPIMDRDYENDPDTEFSFSSKYSKYVNTPTDGVTVSFPKPTTSSVEADLGNYRTAKLLAESIQFVFSKYGNDTGNYDVDQFIEDKVAVDPDIEYGYIGPRTTSVRSLFSGGRFVLKNFETVKRLGYVLKHALVRNSNKIMNYHTYEYFDNYYTSIESFRQGDDYVLVTSLDNTLSWDLNVFDKIQATANSSYFLRVFDNIYTAKPILGIPDDAEVYVYNSNEDITKVRNGTGDIVLIYMYNGVRKYLALLKL